MCNELSNLSASLLFADFQASFLELSASGLRAPLLDEDISFEVCLRALRLTLPLREVGGVAVGFAGCAIRSRGGVFEERA